MNFPPSQLFQRHKLNPILKPRIDYIKPVAYLIRERPCSRMAGLYSYGVLRIDELTPIYALREADSSIASAAGSIRMLQRLNEHT